jgi:hypothetical protein
MTTYLGMPIRTAAAVAAVAVAAGALLGTILPTPDPAATGCTLVEDGPTGPEPGVTLSRVTYACPDYYLHVTYVTGDRADVVQVDRAPLAPCGYVVEGAEVVPASCSTATELHARLGAIRADRAGGRW